MKLQYLHNHINFCNIFIVTNFFVLVEKMTEQAVRWVTYSHGTQRFVISCIGPCPKPVKWRASIFIPYSAMIPLIVTALLLKGLVTGFSPVVIFRNNFMQFFPFLLNAHPQYPSRFMINIPTLYLYNYSVYILYWTQIIQFKYTSKLACLLSRVSLRPYYNIQGHLLTFWRLMSTIVVIPHR